MQDWIELRYVTIDIAWAIFVLACCITALFCRVYTNSKRLNIIIECLTIGAVEKAIDEKKQEK